MKVVINAGYGGFGLSEAAVEFCLDRGMKLGRLVNGEAKMVKFLRAIAPTH